MVTDAEGSKWFSSHLFYSLTMDLLSMDVQSNQVVSSKEGRRKVSIREIYKCDLPPWMQISWASLDCFVLTVLLTSKQLWDACSSFELNARPFSLNVTSELSQLSTHLQSLALPHISGVKWNTLLQGLGRMWHPELSSKGLDDEVWIYRMVFLCVLNLCIYVYVGVCAHISWCEFGHTCGSQRRTLDICLCCSGRVSLLFFYFVFQANQPTSSWTFFSLSLVSH